MPWLILPPRNNGKPYVNVGLGSTSNWPDVASFQVFTSVVVNEPPHGGYTLPPSRDPDRATQPVTLPSHFLIIPYDENGRLTLEPISEMPDVIFGAGYSWMVSERFKNILETTAPGAARFDPITLKGPKNSDLPGHWFLLVFQQFANIIDEERSNLLRIYEQMANWDRPGSEQPTVLFAESSTQPRYDFWSGVAPDDTSRTKAANASLTYCSDAVMQVFEENQITGFGPCFKIDLLNEDNNAQMAIGSPKDAKAKAQIEADTHQLLSCEVIHSFGPTQANPKHPPHDGLSDIELPIPVDEELPDLWRMNNYLVVSETAKSLLETLIPDDVQFAKVIPEPLQSGATYSGPQLHLLTPLKKFSAILIRIIRKHASFGGGFGRDDTESCY